MPKLFTVTTFFFFFYTTMDFMCIVPSTAFAHLLVSAKILKTLLEKIFKRIEDMQKPSVVGFEVRYKK